MSSDTLAGAAVSRFSRWQPWISTAIRLVLAGILFAAGAIKAVDPVKSVAAVNAYDIFPAGVAKLIGYGLPGLEIALAVLLLLGLATRAAAAVTAGLMVVFIAGIISAWARGLSIDCGCFGGGGEIDANQTRYLEEILRDTGFFLLAAWLVVFPRSRFALDGRGDAEDASFDDDTSLDDGTLLDDDMSEHHHMHENVTEEHAG